jgi:hypothetical protein
VPHTTPGLSSQPTAEEITVCEAFADRLLAEYDAQMYDQVALAANACPADMVTKEDITRLGPFINGLIVRLFALGVAAGLADIAKQQDAAAASTVTLQ